MIRTFQVVVTVAILAIAGALVATAFVPSWDHDVRSMVRLTMFSSPHSAGPVSAAIRRLTESRPTHRVPFPPIDDWNSLSIKLERKSCFGMCPQYAVEIRGTGLVEYKGEAFVALHGHHRAQISRQAVEQLVAQLRGAEFFWLHNEYTAAVTDNPTQIVTVAFDRRSKTVRDYVGYEAGMPEVVTDIEDAIDRAVNIERWTQGNKDTVPSLTAENWNFKSMSAENQSIVAGIAAYGEPQALRAVLALGAPMSGANDPTARRYVSYTGEGAALDAAITRGDGEIVRIILDAQPTWTRVQFGETLLEAAVRRKTDIVATLIAAGADPTYQRPMTPRTERPSYSGYGDAGRTVLMNAALSGMPDIVAQILKARPDVNAREERGWTALHFTASKDYETYGYGELKPETMRPRVVELLIAAGANVNARTETGATPLMTALTDGDVVEALIRGGADINARDAKGRTALAQAVDIRVNSLLTKAGAKP